VQGLFGPALPPANLVREVIWPERRVPAGIFHSLASVSRPLETPGTGHQMMGLARVPYTPCVRGAAGGSGESKNVTFVIFGC